MLAFGFAALLVFGVLLVLVGSNIAELAAAMQLDMEQIGLLGATLSVGIGSGVLLAGPLVDRFPRRPMLVASLALTAAALLSVDPVMGLERAMLHVTIAGMGAGFYETLLNVVTIEMPALRDREADILELAEYFLADFCGQAGREVPRFSAAAHRRLLGHAWPGNVQTYG